MPRARVLLLAIIVFACGPAPGVRDTNGDGRIIVACLGDSNTESRWPPPYTPKWCEAVADAQRGWVVANHAVGGATVTRPTDARSSADDQLDGALAGGPVDAVVLAFGTNDVRFGRTTHEIVAAYRAAMARVAAHGATAWVALAPPIFPPEPDRAAAIEALNAALRADVPAPNLVDFATGMTPADFEPDGLHPNLAGQRKRAAAALRVLRPD